MRDGILDRMLWHEYVAKVIGADRQVDVAAKTGIDQTTISRWLNPEQPGGRRISSQSVAAFARGYGRPVIEAFVMAGFLTREEADMTGDPFIDLSDVPEDAMINELYRRRHPKSRPSELRNGGGRHGAPAVSGL